MRFSKLERAELVVGCAAPRQGARQQADVPDAFERIPAASAEVVVDAAVE
jgi:hypothetical protein